MRAVAKGARKTTSRLAGASEPLMLLDALMAEGASLDILSQAEVRESLSRVTVTGDTGKAVTVKEGFPDGPVAVTVVGTTAYVLEGQLGLMMNPPKAGEAPPAPKPYKATAVEVGKP